MCSVNRRTEGEVLCLSVPSASWTDLSFPKYPVSTASPVFSYIPASESISSLLEVEPTDSSQALHLCSLQGHGSVTAGWKLFVRCFRALKLLPGFVKLSLSFCWWEFGILSALSWYQLCHKTCKSLVSWRYLPSVRYGHQAENHTALIL